MASINQFITVLVGLLVIGIVATLAPSIGDDVQTSIGTPAAGSDWDSTNVSTSGADIYGDNIGMISTGVMIVIVAIFLGAIRGGFMKGK